MSKSAIDATVNNSVFRKDNPIILAMRRDLAVIQPVRLAYDANGYMPGQILDYKAADGLYYKHSAVSGTLNATCVLFEQVTSDDQLTQGASGNSLARAIFGGLVFGDLLLDNNAGATGSSGLNGRAYKDATGVNVFKF